jgi:hypothetical protein
MCTDGQTKGEAILIGTPKKRAVSKRAPATSKAGAALTVTAASILNVLAFNEISNITNIKTLDIAATSYFKTLDLNNTNMAAVRTYEIEATLVKFRVALRNSVR